MTPLNLQRRLLLTLVEMILGAGIVLKAPLLAKMETVM
jgi:hypothetical protein